MRSTCLALFALDLATFYWTTVGNEEDAGRIHAIDVGWGAMAVARRDSLELYELTAYESGNPTGKITHRIKWDEGYFGVSGSELLDFKLVNSTLLYVCSTSACALYNFDADTDANIWKKFPKLEITKILSARINVIAGNVLIGTSGGFLVFCTFGNTLEEFHGWTFNHTINDSVVATARYTHRDTDEDRAYFILSGRQSSITSLQQNARIARIAGNNQLRTIDYASLKCANVDHPHKATAAWGTFDDSAIYVAFRNGTEPWGNSVICKFMWRNVHETFGEERKGRTVMGSVVAEFKPAKALIVDITEGLETHPVLFVLFDTGLLQRVVIARMSCSTFYKSCDSISWNDPFKCAWCENQYESYAMQQSGNSACDGGKLFTGECPEPDDQHAAKASLAARGVVCLLLIICLACVFLHYANARRHRRAAKNGASVVPLNDAHGRPACCAAPGQINPANLTILAPAGSEPEDVIQEIVYLSTCDHENIIRFVGHYCESGMPRIVTEFMAGGDLRTYLDSPSKELPIQIALSYMLQIVEGMHYLSTKHIIHRDLAARNCLLDSTFQLLKITDFGLCRKSGINYDYLSMDVSRKLPIPWFAPECFPKDDIMTFSHKSDVWAFGVTAWEIVSRRKPYTDEGIEDANQMLAFLKSGQRLPEVDPSPNRLLSLRGRLNEDDNPECGLPHRRRTRGSLRTHTTSSGSSRPLRSIRRGDPFPLFNGHEFETHEELAFTAEEEYDWPNEPISTATLMPHSIGTGIAREPELLLAPGTSAQQTSRDAVYEDHSYEDDLYEDRFHGGDPHDDRLYDDDFYEDRAYEASVYEERAYEASVYDERDYGGDFYDDDSVR